VNIEYEILTPDGFKPFSGVYKKKTTGIVEIESENGKHLGCTPDHLLLTNRGFVPVNEIGTRDIIFTDEGPTSIVSQREVLGEEWVYDVLDVDDNHCYLTNGFVSHNCRFFGSSDTLISGDCLEKLIYENPIESDEHTLIYAKPVEDHVYVLCADVSEGVGKDYSTIQVIDVTHKPYRQVYAYHRNDLSPWLMSGLVNMVGKTYNEAYALIENNSVGKIVADGLFYEYEYDNIISSKMKAGDEEIEGMTMKKVGVQMNRKTKLMGCTALKSLLEEDHLIIVDYETIQELSSFVKKSNSYQAEKNKYDDLVMPLVLFGWLTTQPYFEDIANVGLQHLLKDKRDKEAENSHLAFGFFNDGTDELLEFAL